MKTKLYIISFVLLLLTVACTTVEQDMPSSKTDMTFVAEWAEMQTKTAFQADGTSIWWSPSDEICIYYGASEGNKFTSTNDAEVPKAEFRGTLNAFTGESEAGVAYYFWAVYPYESAVSCDGESVVATLADEQMAKAGSFAPNTNIAIAKSTGLNLSFYNACSWFRFSVTKEGVKRVIFRGNNDEDVTGKFRVSMGEDNRPTAPEVIEGKKEITLHLPDYEPFEVGKIYYITLFPQVFTKGFTVTFKTDTEIATRSISAKATFLRSKYNSGIGFDSPEKGVVYTEAVKSVAAEGGKVELVFLSDTPCEAVIPDDAKSWISVVPETKAIEKQTITLNIEPNTGAARSATVIIRNGDNSINLPYDIEQSANHDYQLAIEREALIAIYNSVSLESQTRMTGWVTDAPLSTWYGIDLNADGFVESIRLFDVDFVKSIPSEIGSLKRLKEFFVLGSDLSGTYGREGCFLVPEIGELTELERFFIQRQGFVGAIPKEISKLKNLKELCITETGINGVIPPEICNLENLEDLNLSFNPLTGTIPLEIGQLKNLRKLRLHGRESQLSGSIPVELCTLEKMEELFLGAKLSGTIPHEIGNLTNLKKFTINWSNITGEIPEEIGNLSNLESLQIDDSPITGSIPQSLTNCQKLENLFIEACPITGPLPAWLSEIKSLKRLSFYMTNMSGIIPKEWSQCPLLHDINLSNCPYLYGSIPKELMELEAFKYRWGNWVNGTNFNLIGVKIPAPDFIATSLDGVNINSAEEYANNKFTILFQWNYWCPSIVETPTLVNLYNNYHDRGLNVIGWSDDDAEDYLEHPKPMRETIAEYEMPWQNFVVPAGERDGYGVFGNITNKYPGNIAGAIALVDEDGYVIWSNLYDSMENLTRIIDEYFEEGDNGYKSTDYSLDGKVTKMKSAVKGNGINLILMGDGYSDRLILDGTYQQVMEKMATSFLGDEPYSSYKDFFNIYSVDVVSPYESSEDGFTALRTWFGEGTKVGGNNSVCIDYALKAIPAGQMDDALIVVAINSEAYAGTCYMYETPDGDYGRGLSVSYFPVGSDENQIRGLVSHEAGGHGFAKLADEYAYEYMGAVTSDAINSTKTMEPYGWWKNVDFTSDPSQVKWSQFIADERYASENIGCFEGGLTYWTGVWRPTDASIMRYNTGGFNAPSRYAIWYRIGKLAYGESWEGSYEDFVAYDQVNRTPAAAARRKVQRRNYVTKPLPQLPPPVVIGHSWREEK